MFWSWSRPKNTRVEVFEWREKCLWWERKISIEREVRKWNLISRSAIYRKTHLDGLRSYRDLLSTKSRQIWICRGVVENLSTAKVPWWIEILLRIYWPNRNFLDGSRSCRGAIETNSRNLDGSSMRLLLSRKCKAFMIQNTHTYETSLINFIFQKQAKTV